MLLRGCSLHVLSPDEAQSLWAACPTGLFRPRKWVPHVASSMKHCTITTIDLYVQNFQPSISLGVWAVCSKSLPLRGMTYWHFTPNSPKMSVYKASVCVWGGGWSLWPCTGLRKGCLLRSYMTGVRRREVKSWLSFLSLGRSGQCRWTLKSKGQTEAFCFNFSYLASKFNICEQRS